MIEIVQVEEMKPVDCKEPLFSRPCSDPDPAMKRRQQSKRKIAQFTLVLVRLQEGVIDCTCSTEVFLDNQLPPCQLNVPEALFYMLGMSVLHRTAEGKKTKDMSLKPQERKEKWERHPGKKPRESENYVSAEPSENGHNNDAGSSEREAERGKERVKKKHPLKISKQIQHSSSNIPSSEHLPPETPSKASDNTKEDMT
ncbi:hypothetical protein KIL84_009014 [Mauremys mutica]|uniref:Uncharacterized protein n=1 Tax=Mauremys mutica TaxID=74926 RepID=A0A9D4B3I8_9SAUR|nr:hypothetical protein KIL84_009014 [Mauremys mutica]